jgi:hypothetical protein
MKTPIFIFEDDDYSCFKSIQDASKYLEGWQVVQNILTAYDSEGRLLKLSAKDEYDTVKISLAEEIPAHQEELKEKLIHSLEYFHEIGKLDNIDWLKDAALCDLVNEIIKFGYDR